MIRGDMALATDRKYLIIPATEVKKVDFDQVLEFSELTLSYSGDGKKTFIKWTGDDPDFISTLKKAEGPYSHEELLEIIRSSDWTNPKKKATKKVT